jgi:hypothetical protein
VIAGVRDDLSLDMFKTTRGFEIGFIVGEEGIGSREILDQEWRDQKWYLYGTHALILIWACVLLSTVEGRFDFSLKTLGKVVSLWVGSTEGIRAVVQGSAGGRRVAAIVGSIGVLYILLSPKKRERPAGNTH